MNLRDPTYIVPPHSIPRPARASKSKRVLHFLERVAHADVPQVVLDLFEVGLYPFINIRTNRLPKPFYMRHVNE